MGKDYLENITDIVFNAPMWVQEIVFLDLKKHLSQKYGDKAMTINESDIYPAYVPELTFKGKKELETHEHGLEPNVYKCFSQILEGKRIVDITLNNFWTLEETSSYVAIGIENEFINPPESLHILSAILYIGSQIRLGEYIKRLKKIDIVQLDDVLRKQKNQNDNTLGEKKRIGEVLMEMGYIANNDIDSILSIKEESKKRFVIKTATSAEVPSNDQNNAELLAKINKLTQENKLLKDKLRAIFNLQNKNK